MAVVDVLAGGAMALAGGFGTTFLQARNQARARSEERNEKRREIRRAKAERVFEETNAVADGYRQQVVQVVLNFNKEKPDAVVQPSAAVLDALVSIYFPNCRPIVDRFQADLKVIGSKHAQQAADAMKQTGAPAAGKLMAINFSMSKEFSDRASALANELRAAMQPEVENLW